MLAGDFWAEPRCTRRGGLGKVGPVWSAFGGTSRWVAGVLGNHDQYEHHRPPQDEGREPSPCRVALLDGDGNRVTVKKEAKGFTIRFEKAAPENAKLDWMIVR